ncbi:MAG TPA: hypothetical protein DEP08_01570 [Candidatus Jacksonbacteria bacterium]|nr:hypothetical protein [Candidatus Jacksonbacteria bacterium]
MLEENILPQTPSPHSSTKRKTSLVSVLLTIALTIAFVIFGERLLHDVNRWFNPASQQYGFAPQTALEILIPTAHAQELIARIADEYPTTTTSIKSDYSRQSYETYRLLLHAAVIIPVFLLMFLVYYYFRFKRTGSPYKILSYAYMAFAFYMILRLLAELCVFVIKNLKTAGVYIVLGIVIVVFTTLIVIIQKKLHSKDGAE